jgi:Fe-S-cluster containining protein
MSMNDTSMINPDVCSRCAARGRTCCTVSSGDEEFCFPISIPEMEAIRSAGQGGEDCFALAPNTAGFVKQLSMLMPAADIRGAFPKQGSHWRLATTEQGDCVFLGPAGCVLARSVRPAYCRLFPLWVFHGKLTWFTAGECLVNEECSSLAPMLAALGTDSARVRELFAEMCSKLGLESDPKVK